MFLQSGNPANAPHACGVTGAATLCGMLSVFPEAIDKFREERQKRQGGWRSLVVYTEAHKYIDVYVRVRESKMNSFGIVNKHLQDVRQICISYICSENHHWEAAFGPQLWAIKALTSPKTCTERVSLMFLSQTLLLDFSGEQNNP